MKKLILFLFITPFIACTQVTKEDPYTGASMLRSSEFTETTYEGCDYLIYDHGLMGRRVFAITHKGNCRNSIHKQN